MLKRLLEFLLILLTLRPTISQSTEKIVGGEEAEAGRYPFVVSIVDGRETQFCAGVLIASGWVLTAAHCGKDRGAYVQIGRHNIDNKEEDYENIPILAEYEHPDWCPDTMEYNFMLIRLEYDSDYEPIDLPDSDMVVESGTVVRVIGWGATYFGGPRSEVLMQADFSVLDNFWCEQHYSDIQDVTEDMMCAYEEGKDACQGDSGGPLFLDNDEDGDILLGIVSWGTQCADPDYPGVYARVTSAKPWIEEIMGNGGGLRLSQVIKYRTKRMFKGLRK